MASAPRPSSEPRRAWRERQQAAAASGQSKHFKRWLLTFVLLGLVAAFVAFFWQTLGRQPRVFLAGLPITEYKLGVVPRPYYAQNDVETLRRTESRYEWYDGLSHVNTN